MGSLTENPATQGKGGYRVGDEPTAQANPVRANYGAVQPYIQNCHGLLRRLIHLGEKVRGKSEVVEPSMILSTTHFSYPIEWRTCTGGIDQLIFP